MRLLPNIFRPLLKTRTPDVFVTALGDVAKARGMAQIAKESGLGRESLYKSSERGCASTL
jgi:probable addiction module antidote protein